MISRKRQFDYFTHHVENLFLHLLSFEKKSAPEQLHYLRVEIKKIRALLVLQNYYSGEQFHEMNAVLKTIFQLSGTIRTHVNYLKFVNQLKIKNNSIIKKLEDEIKVGTEKFRGATTSSLSLLKICIKKSAEKIRPVKTKVILELHEHYYRKIKKHLRSIAEPDEFHKARKQLKIILYLHSLLPKTMNKKINSNINYIDKLQDEIGKWHDAVLADQFLKQTGIANQVILKKSEKKLTFRMEKLLRLTGKLTEQFYLS
jgi:CHAD domain-containing protein